MPTSDPKAPVADEAAFAALTGEIQRLANELFRAPPAEVDTESPTGAATSSALPAEGGLAPPPPKEPVPAKDVPRAPALIDPGALFGHAPPGFALGAAVPGAA